MIHENTIWPREINVCASNKSNGQIERDEKKLKKI